MMYCRNCGTALGEGAAFCSTCGAPAGAGTQFCPDCGRPTPVDASACPYCGRILAGGQGYQNNPNPGYQGYPPYSGQQPYYPADTRRSKVAAGLLAIFLGYLGIHNFYLGFTNKAVIQLVVGTVGGLLTCGIATAAVGIWGLIEGIMIFTGSIAVDAQGYPLKD